MKRLAHKAEFPPLLPKGFHAHSVDEVRLLCVDGFPESANRPDMMAALLVIFERIAAVEIMCEVWLDGSFATKKVDPDDVDFIVIAPWHYRSEGTPEQGELIEWLIARENEPKSHFRCDTDVILEFPETHPFFALTEESKVHFAKIYGYSVATNEPKGIIVLKIENKEPDEPQEIAEGEGEK